MGSFLFWHQEIKLECLHLPPSWIGTLTCNILPQDTLPPPRAHQVVDWNKNDFELFQKYILPNGGRCALGDMWDDAPGTKKNQLVKCQQWFEHSWPFLATIYLQRSTFEPDGDLYPFALPNLQN